MTITVQTTITYDPIKEYEEIKRFIAEHDIGPEWQVREATTATTFTRTDRYYRVSDFSV